MALHEVVADGVATITMDNPPVNALGVGDTYALAGMLDGYRTRDDVRVVVLTATGRGFCAGVDIKEIQAIDADGGLTVSMDRALNKLGHAMHDLDPVFDRFSRTPALAGLADDLGFVEPLLLQSMVIFKPPHIGGEVVCHCDHSFLWTEPQSVVGFWFALDDATVDNGCMWAIPGAHLGGARTRFRLEGAGTTTDVLDPTPYDMDALVPLEVAAGTCIAFHGCLPHWSAPNTSERPRLAYTLHVIDGTARYLEDNWLQRGPALPLRGF